MILRRYELREATAFQRLPVPGEVQAFVMRLSPLPFFYRFRLLFHRGISVASCALNTRRDDASTGLRGYSQRSVRRSWPEFLAIFSSGISSPRVTKPRHRHMLCLRTSIRNSHNGSSSWSITHLTSLTKSFCSIGDNKNNATTPSEAISPPFKDLSAFARYSSRPSLTPALGYLFIKHVLFMSFSALCLFVVHISFVHLYNDADGDHHVFHRRNQRAKSGDGSSIYQ